jgi:hypothetical protein
MLTAEDVILLIEPPFQERLCLFFPEKEAHFFPLSHLSFNLVAQLVGHLAPSRSESRRRNNICIFAKRDEFLCNKPENSTTEEPGS